MIDEEFDDFWQDDLRGNASDAMEDIFKEVGGRENFWIGSLGAYALAEMFDLKREKQALLLTLESVILSTVFAEGLKFATDRTRPSDTDDAFDWDGPTTESNTSFASSHASGAFAAATVFADIYGDDYPWVPWIAYPAATAIGLARINAGRHWASDIFLGGAIGYFVGKMVTRYDPFLRDHNVSVLPFAEEGASGAAISFRF